MDQRNSIEKREVICDNTEQYRSLSCILIHGMECKDDEGFEVFYKDRPRL